MKLQEGTKLTVRDDLKLGLDFESGIVSEMLEFKGMDVTLTRYSGENNSFHIKEDDEVWFWDKEMFKEFL